MKKVESTNGKVEFQFGIDVDEGYTRTSSLLNKKRYLIMRIHTG